MPAETLTALIWLAAVIAFVVLEALTVQLISIWLAAAALVSLILSLLGAPLWAQCAAFVVCVFLLLYLTRPIVRRLMKRPAVRTNADRTIGMTAIVVQEIDNDAATGQVKAGSQIWTARSLSGDILQPGDKVVVHSIEGVKLIVSELSGVTHQ